MIATQSYPTATFPENRDRDAAQYLPAKDVESFKKLLPPPIEFVEGSSSGTLAIGDGKYQPINVPPTPSRKPEPCTTSQTRQPSSPSALPSPVAPQASPNPLKELWTRPIETTWPSSSLMGCGLINTGNTCFLNSALQCLIYTPPLVRVLSAHNKSDLCNVKKNAFCMSCSLRNLMQESFSRKTATTPYQITAKLSEIAKHMRRGRQEDSHEFLRYAIDALQKSCLAGLPKTDHKLAMTTWVHKIFGGKLRSRVTCLSCGYNSDTFDDMLDLSVDIYGADTLQKALRKFVAVDHLKGADKYKCDKCKKHVSADKSFSVHKAPVVLSIHLKRFTPMGRKMSQPIRYDDRLSLQPVMSEGQFGPTYGLYGVISHAGGGPNSGHYYAHIKNANGQWHEMNDETVTRVSGAPTNMKNAYILFYLVNKGQALEAAVSAPSLSPTKPVLATAIPGRTGLVASMKKRKVVDDDDDKAPASKPFIGPLPSPVPDRAASPHDAKKQKPNPLDPQAQVLKQKIAAASQGPSTRKVASPTKALQVLSQYKDDDDDDVGEKVELLDEEMHVEESEPEKVVSKVSTEAALTNVLLPSPALIERSLPPTSSSVATSSSSVGVVPAASFYSTAGSKQKGKNKDFMSDEDRKSWARTPLTPPKHSSLNRYASGNPFTRLTGSNNLRQQFQRDNATSSLSTKRFKRRSMAI